MADPWAGNAFICVSFITAIWKQESFDFSTNGLSINQSGFFKVAVQEGGLRKYYKKKLR